MNGESMTGSIFVVVVCVCVFWVGLFVFFGGEGQYCSKDRDL